MRITIEDLRRWILLLAAVAAGGVLALLLWGRHERRRLLHDLPAKLGIDIQQQTNEFTYSQSVQGRTLFTLHAAKAVQMKQGGHIKLHDVTIILYGRKQDRADRIAGQEFDYDPASGVARATGEVFLDLQAPDKAVAASVRQTAAADAASDLGAGGGRVHVTARGLVFQQKLGLASTPDDISFHFGGGVTGHAHGAQYDSGRGILTLDSDVTADTLQQGRPVRVTASHGEVNRDTNLCVFQHAAYTASGNTAAADVASVQLRTDGSAERIEMRGDVTLHLARGGVLRAPFAVARLNAVSEPGDLLAQGGVHYAGAADAQSESSGDAQSAHILFDAHGVMRQAVLDGGVHTLERERDKNASAWTERELRAATVQLAFQSTAGASPLLREATAAGEARMRLSSPAKPSPSARPGASSTTLLAGDTLHASFAGRGSGPRTVEGAGHTVLTQTAADGTVNESRGDSLSADLNPAAAKHAQPNAAGQIEHAVQQGHVIVTQTPPPGSAHADALRVTAARAEYKGGDDSVLMTGAPDAPPHASDGTMQLAARSIHLMRGTGVATLNGRVSGNYTVAGAQLPAHIVADRAEIRHADQHALFNGAPRARLWQDASLVEAPVLDLDRAAQRLTASGNPRDAAPVHVVFSGMGAPPSASQPANKPAQVMRVDSRRMVYSGLAAAGKDARRQADFTGGVTVQSADGTIRAQHAVVYMTDAAPHAAAAPLLFTGNVQSVVAEGQVALSTGDRQGSGERLVYTPDRAVSPVARGNNGEFVLTGTPAAPPRLLDPARGGITGASLKFNSGDDSVVVSGGVAAGGQVRTELKVGR